jgi:pyroglutamyl-peptidase
MSTRRTLLTGFGAFGAVVSNPTERLVERFAGEVDTLILPTSFAHAPRRVLGALADGRYDRVVMLGVAASTPGFRVERFAHNWDEGGTRDVDGFVAPARRIASVAPARLPVTIEVERWVDALSRALSEIPQNRVPVALSESAGGFLCNHALFHALRHARAAGRGTRIGFLHVPADEQTGVSGAATCPFSTQVAVIRALLTA